MVNCNNCKRFAVGMCTIDNEELENTVWERCDFYMASKTCKSCIKNAPCVKVLRDIEIQFNECIDYMAYREMNAGDDCPAWEDEEIIDEDTPEEEEVSDEGTEEVPDEEVSEDVPETQEMTAVDAEPKSEEEDVQEEEVQQASPQSEEIRFSNIL